jgi:hypothetical protein
MSPPTTLRTGRQIIRSKLRLLWLAPILGICGLMLVPLTVGFSVNETPPLASQINTTGGIGACGDQSHWNVNSLNTNTGVGGFYSHSGVNGGACGGGTVSVNEQVQDGAHLTSFQWTHGTRTFNISVIWTIAARLTTNTSNCNGAARGSLEIRLNLWDTGTQRYVWSTQPVHSIFNQSAGCSGYSHTYASTQYNFTVPGGIPMTYLDNYDPHTQLHVWTSASTTISAADAMVDVQTNNGQQNGATLDSINIW